MPMRPVQQRGYGVLRCLWATEGVASGTARRTDARKTLYPGRNETADRQRFGNQSQVWELIP